MERNTHSHITRTGPEVADVVLVGGAIAFSLTFALAVWLPAHFGYGHPVSEPEGKAGLLLAAAAVYLALTAGAPNVVHAVVVVVFVPLPNSLRDDAVSAYLGHDTLNGGGLVLLLLPGVAFGFALLRLVLVRQRLVTASKAVEPSPAADVVVLVVCADRRPDSRNGLLLAGVLGLAAVLLLTRGRRTR